MDIRQLRYFIAIAEERQITAAAKRLHMAQPPLSQQLQLMERELGVTLLERQGRQLKLTEAGRLLYKHALHITKLFEESQIEVKEAGIGLTGKLSIGVNTLSDGGLPELLRTFREKFPAITYKIQQNESAQLCKLVKERAIELAIVRFPLDLSEFSIRHLREERFFYVTSRRRRPLDGKSISLGQIGQEPLILPSTEGLGVYQMIVEEFARHGLKPNVLSECSDIAMLLELVSSDFAATLVPESVLELHRGFDLQVYELAGTHIASSSVLIWLKDHYLSKAAQNFIELTGGAPL
ncbi:LysR family transcriptional regulator [Paenibacillus sp. MZ04-78.2]|uniref:LysR family transcriptional regulator n=1 Tax=Paenibacillus sp. MZ04-78.2 TaxID=2962034 RepID=UPI0020B82FD2|nr:LysR family transcriptional regulator [Paenibacillus sp. MZ04-78.2]MCP3774657.1 LysR family transcriptional regulator [Paenibacillus sp. MZ04-78.2]